MEYVTAAGVDVPALGFGTARMDGHEERRRAVSAALDAGYRHVDTAQIYGSEPAVGEAVRESPVDREELFVTTKLSRDNRAYDDAVASTRASLDRLDTDYVDLLLVHSPNDDVPHAETLRAMNDCRDDGLVRHVGVSNFSVEQTREAMDASEAPILTNQVEYHVRKRRDDLLRFCVEEGVMLTAYSPLDVGGLADDGALAEIGDRYGKTASQVALRWLVQQPMVSAIPMSSNPEHVRANVDVFDFELTADEMERLFDRGGPIDGIRSALGL
ncbi:aldo/keto reductase [Halosimplex rubrum]|uniref:Aldo/keto reductase n=1 Tax=Halosimplex rubrum TaxID=869889 RepID=A0A7D5T3F0_9EURY|nr:aldo/keto reductase [Halosimplex rubrum]QLH75893.1 aldo/keto reductase [Halosimplex rubrum]